MATFSLTTGKDTFVGGPDDDTLTGTAATVNPGDSLAGGGGNNTLALYGSGTYDLRGLAQFTGFGEIDLVDISAGGQTTLYVPDAPDLLVAARGNNDVVIYTGSGNDTINAAGIGSAEIHLGSGSGTDAITVTDSGPNQFTLADGIADITVTTSSSNQFTLGSGTAKITATVTDYLGSNSFTLESVTATITATTAVKYFWDFTFDPIRLIPHYGNNYFTLGSGTFDIHAIGNNNFSASDPSYLHAGDVIDIDVTAGSNGS